MSDNASQSVEQLHAVREAGQRIVIDQVSNVFVGPGMTLVHGNQSPGHVASLSLLGKDSGQLLLRN